MTVPGTAERGRRVEYPWGLLWNLTLRELRGKYKRSVLGWGWSVMNPIVFLAVYSFVFGVIFQSRQAPGDPSGIDQFAFFLVSGYLAWTLHSNCVNGAVGTLAGNGALIRKVYFPRSVLPASNALAWFLTFLIELLVLVVALALFATVNPALVPLVVVAAVIQTIFSLGIGLAVAALNALFRDVEYLTSIVVQVWFWATPIVYPISILTDRDTPVTVLGVDVASAIRLNPMYHFIRIFRDLLYDQRLPAAGSWLVILGLAAVSLTVGALVFKRIEPRLADEL